MLRLDAAVRQYRRMQRLSARAVASARGAWRLLDQHALDVTTPRYLARMLPILLASQQAAATSASAYVDGALREQGLDLAPLGELAPMSLVGFASDGRPLESLLVAPVRRVKRLSADGVPVSQAMRSGRASLERIVATQVADAGRVATGVEIAARPRVGYVRMLNPPSCSRCVILAGRWYRYSAGFQGHPRCLPAGVVVSGPATVAATRRWYQGELVVLTTASGQELPITGNHPVLTDRGWLPAHLVEEGDYVVRSARSQGATPLVVPHEHQVPTRIEDLWRPDGVMPLFKVPTTTEDFHGDGGHGEVDVVLADRLLWDRFEPAGYEFIEQEQLSGGVAQAALLAQHGAAQQLLLAAARAAYGGVGGSSLPATFLGGHAAGAHLAGCGHVADLDSGGYESAPDDIAADAVAEAEAVLALAGRVRRREVGGWQHVLSTRWDSPAGPFTVESRGAYASSGKDLLLRLAGQVELDRVVELRRVEWGGHVYNLTSAEGWYSANGIIVSNCDCIHVPSTEAAGRDLTTDPRAYFDSLSPEEQDRIFTKAGAQAIRDGASISQVVNARRGMRTASVFGRDVLITLEGITRRGLAGRRLISEGARVQREIAERVTRLSREGAVQRQVRRGRVQIPRLMPEQIYRVATSRDDAIRLLRRFGYIT